MKTASEQEVLLVSGDDWEGIYVDGKIHVQGHQVRLEDFARIFGIELKHKGVGSGWLYDEGHLPYNLEDIPEDQFL